MVHQPFEYHRLQSQSVSKTRYVPMGQKESITVCTIPSHGPFQAILRFPKLPHAHDFFVPRTDMERGITYMVLVKLHKLASQNELASQESRKNSIIYTTSAGIIALSAYLLKSYLTSVNSNQ